MKHTFVSGCCAGVLLALAAVPVLAHCQMPCGIYDDAARIARIREDITTIEKAVRAVQDLSSKSDAESLNQAVRWINVKEEHASDIIEIVSVYFLTQRVKPADPRDRKKWDAYTESLADHHAVMRAAMKTKQNVGLDAVEELKAAVDKLASRYVPEEDAGPAPEAPAMRSHRKSHR